MKKRINNILMTVAFLALAIPVIAGAGAYAPIINTGETTVTAPSLGGAYLVFAGKMGGDISKQDLVKQTELQVSGCAVGSQIFQYTVDITKNGKTQSYKAMDNLLSNEVCNILKSLAVGDTIEFKKIRARLPNGAGSVDVYARKFTVT